MILCPESSALLQAAPFMHVSGKLGNLADRALEFVELRGLEFLALKISCATVPKKFPEALRVLDSD